MNIYSFYDYQFILFGDLDMAAKSNTRKERERLARKQEVLEVALALFSEKGFHEVSMQEVADRAEFSVGTLYNLFGKKDGLFDELIEHAGKLILEDVLPILDMPGTEETRLRAFLQHQPQVMEDHARFITLYVTVMGQKGSKFAQNHTKDEIHEVIVARITSLVESGINQGCFRTVHPMITAKAVISMLETMAIEVAGQFDRDKVVAMFVEIEKLFVDGLLLRGDQANEV
jgi:AcrR family transcriptional regulator